MSSALRLTGWITYNGCFPFIKFFINKVKGKQILRGRDDTSAFCFIGHWWYSISLKAVLEPRKQHYWSSGVLLPEIVFKSLTLWCVASWQQCNQEQPFLEFSKLTVLVIQWIYWGTYVAFLLSTCKPNCWVSGERLTLKTLTSWICNYPEVEQFMCYCSPLRPFPHFETYKIQVVFFCLSSNFWKKKVRKVNVNV